MNASNGFAEQAGTIDRNLNLFRGARLFRMQIELVTTTSESTDSSIRCTAGAAEHLVRGASDDTARPPPSITAFAALHRVPAVSIKHRR